MPRTRSTAEEHMQMQGCKARLATSAAQTG